MVTAPVAPAEAAPSSQKVAWQPIAWFGALLLLCYAPVLYRMGVQWATDENMGHGFFVPVVAGIVVWQGRGQLLAAPRKPSNWGLAPIAWAALQELAGTLGAELFTARLAFVIALFGI